ncbi:MAG: hypothetical protein JXM69_16200, partial [Anaerolineae bacterium]|nr:hypothetical protein [Anaerolineae bacterium]
TTTPALIQKFYFLLNFLVSALVCANLTLNDKFGLIYRGRKKMVIALIALAPYAPRSSERDAVSPAVVWA